MALGRRRRLVRPFRRLDGLSSFPSFLPLPGWESQRVRAVEEEGADALKRDRGQTDGQCGGKKERKAMVNLGRSQLGLL